MQSSPQRKAVALISGGLDSMLATKVIQQQGVHIEGINFFTGFCVEGHTQAIRKHEQKKQKRNNALWVAEQLGIKLHIVNIVEEYKAVVINPKHGYGAHLNPCLDCKVFMVGKARQWMQENAFDFIITGEVIGQRPKSQQRKTMPIIAAESGADERLLRPLCAKYLPATLPERKGWVNRAQLFGFSGRSRKPQMALAKQLDIEQYAQPAGGCCFLTDATYASKLADMWAHRGEKHYELDDIMLLKVGRHLRPRPHFKLIIAREEGENRFLEGYRKQFTHLYASSHPGAFALIEGIALCAQDTELAARVLARYGKGRNAKSVTVKIVPLNGIEHEIEVTPMPEKDIPKTWYV